MYYCFVCHEGGDVFSFLTKRLGVDWPTAVRMVAEKSGIEIVETQSRRVDQKDDRDPLWEVNGAAAEYFKRMLWDDALGADAVAQVLQRRGGRCLVVLADVGEEDVLARALAAGDGLADTAGAGDDEDVVLRWVAARTQGA